MYHLISGTCSSWAHRFMLVLLNICCSTNSGSALHSVTWKPQHWYVHSTLSRAVAILAGSVESQLCQNVSPRRWWSGMGSCWQTWCPLLIQYVGITLGHVGELHWFILQWVICSSILSCPWEQWRSCQTAAWQWWCHCILLDSWQGGLTWWFCCTFGLMGTW